jgi:hypothetical protein
MLWPDITNTPQLAEIAFQSFSENLKLESIKGDDSAFSLDGSSPEGIYLGKAWNATIDNTWPSGNRATRYAARSEKCPGKNPQ